MVFFSVLYLFSRSPLLRAIVTMRTSAFVVTVFRLVLIHQEWAPQIAAQSVHDEMLQCVCTTRSCQELGEPVCTTPGLCYSQYLDRKDGSDPVTKGCVNLKTPLLCENRPPKRSSLRARWPILLCCRTPMCNQDDLRLSLVATTASSAIIGEESQPGMGTEGIQPVHNNNSMSNPTVLAVFCLGLAALLAIGITGCCVLTRQGTRQQMF